MRRALLLLATLAAGAASAQTTPNLPAQSAPYTAFEWMQRQTSGSTHHVGMDIGGVRSPADRVNLSGWHPAGNYGVQYTPSGATFGASLEIPDPNGKFRVNYRATTTKAAIADGMGILLRNAANLAGPLGVIAMVADMALQWDQEQLRANPNPETANEKPFMIKEGGGLLTFWESGSPVFRRDGSPCTGYAIFGQTEDNADCGTVGSDGVTRYNGVFFQRVVKCGTSYPRWFAGQPPPTCAEASAANWRSANWADARPKYEAMDPLPSQTMQKQVDWARKQDGQNGIERWKIPVVPLDLTGPASLPSTKTDKNETFKRTGANGQPETVNRNTTTTTEPNITYSGDKAKVNPKVTTTTTDTVTDSDGNTRTETDTTTTETESDTPTKEQQEDYSTTDTPLPPVPDLYERKYPDGIKGVWDEKLATLKTSSLFGIIPGLTPNLGDGGCPVLMMPVDIGLIDFGTFDVSVPCNVWAFVRIVMLITALFLARRLIFGG